MATPVNAPRPQDEGIRDKATSIDSETFHRLLALVQGLGDEIAEYRDSMKLPMTKEEHAAAIEKVKVAWKGLDKGMTDVAQAPVTGDSRVVAWLKDVGNVCHTFDENCRRHGGLANAIFYTDGEGFERVAAEGWALVRSIRKERDTANRFEITEMAPSCDEEPADNSSQSTAEDHANTGPHKPKRGGDRKSGKSKYREVFPFYDQLKQQHSDDVDTEEFLKAVIKLFRRKRPDLIDSVGLTPDRQGAERLRNALKRRPGSNASITKAAEKPKRLEKSNDGSKEESISR